MNGASLSIPALIVRGKDNCFFHGNAPLNIWLSAPYFLSNTQHFIAPRTFSYKLLRNHPPSEHACQKELATSPGLIGSLQYTRITASFQHIPFSRASYRHLSRIQKHALKDDAPPSPMLSLADVAPDSISALQCEEAEVRSLLRE